jgi:hypothetical protein
LDIELPFAGIPPYTSIARVYEFPLELLPPSAGFL